MAQAGVQAFFKALGKVILNIAISAAVSKLLGPKIPKGRRSKHNVMTYSAIEYHKTVYGQAMISGPVVYTNVSGTDNEYLWYQVALTVGRVDSFISVWFDGDEIPVADISWTPDTGSGTGTGAVSTAKWVGENSTTAANIYYYLGYDTQTVNATFDSAHGEIDTTHRMRGISYVLTRLLYDADTENVWQSGPPRDIKAVVKGRLIYDPRKDSTVVIDPDTSPQTFGSGSHRYGDSSTWEWSDNPALCIADYLTQFLNAAPATDIDWPSVATAADDCDVLVEIPPAASPANTEKRFTCNGALSMGDTHKENIAKILSSMQGHLAYSGGKWVVRASTWEASSVSFDADDFAGRVQVRASATKNDRINSIRGHFNDGQRKYETVEFPHVSRAAYVTRDNGQEIFYDLRLPMTITHTAAQRIAYRNLDQADNQTVFTAVMNSAGAKCKVGDVVTWDLPTFGWTGAENLALQSENFATTWALNATTIVNTDQEVGPSGSKTADQLIDDNSSGTGFVRASQSITVSTNTKYVISCFAKQDQLDQLYLDFFNHGALQVQQYFNLVDGTLGGGTGTDNYDQGMVSYGNGWYRCWIAFTSDSVDTTGDFRVLVASGDSGTVDLDGTSSIFVWGAQAEAAGAPSLYKKTTTAAVTTSAKTFRVIEWNAQPGGTFDVTFQEDDAGSYNDPAVSDYGTPGSGGITDPAAIIPPPSALSATPKQLSILLEWTNPPAGTFDYIDIYEGVSNGWNDSPGPGKIAEVRADHYTVQLNGGDTRYYWIRARRVPALESLREPNSDTTTVTATAQNASVQVSVALSGEVITHSGSGAPGKAGIRANSNGTLSKREGDTYTQIDSPEWCDPPEFAPGLYEFKCDSGVSPDNLDAGSDTEGAWLAVTTTREWFISTTGEATKENDVVIRVRRDGGAEIDSATYELNASVGSYNYSVPTDTVQQQVAGTSVDPIAGYRATAAGQNEEANYNSNQSADWAFLSDYLTPADDTKADDLQIRATQSSQTGGGSLSGTLNTWEALSATRTWTITRTALTDGTSEWVLAIDIRDNSVSPPTTVASGTMTLQATRIVI